MSRREELLKIMAQARLADNITQRELLKNQRNLQTQQMLSNLVTQGIPAIADAGFKISGEIDKQNLQKALAAAKSSGEYVPDVEKIFGKEAEAIAVDIAAKNAQFEDAKRMFPGAIPSDAKSKTIFNPNAKERVESEYKPLRFGQDIARESVGIIDEPLVPDAEAQKVDAEGDKYRGRELSNNDKADLWLRENASRLGLVPGSRNYLLARAELLEAMDKAQDKSLDRGLKQAQIASLYAKAQPKSKTPDYVSAISPQLNILARQQIKDIDLSNPQAAGQAIEQLRGKARAELLKLDKSLEEDNVRLEAYVGKAVEGALKNTERQKADQKMIGSFESQLDIARRLEENKRLRKESGFTPETFEIFKAELDKLQLPLNLDTYGKVYRELRTRMRVTDAMKEYLRHTAELQNEIMKGMNQGYNITEGDARRLQGATLDAYLTNEEYELALNNISRDILIRTKNDYENFSPYWQIPENVSGRIRSLDVGGLATETKGQPLMTRSDVASAGQIAGQEIGDTAKGIGQALGPMKEAAFEAGTDVAAGTISSATGISKDDAKKALDFLLNLGPKAKEFLGANFGKEDPRGLDNPQTLKGEIFKVVVDLKNQLNLSEEDYVKLQNAAVEAENIYQAKRKDSGSEASWEALNSFLVEKAKGLRSATPPTVKEENIQDPKQIFDIIFNRKLEEFNKIHPPADAFRKAQEAAREVVNKLLESKTFQELNPPQPNIPTQQIEGINNETKQRIPTQGTDNANKSSRELIRLFSLPNNELLAEVAQPNSEASKLYKMSGVKGADAFKKWLSNQMANPTDKGSMLQRDRASILADLLFPTSNRGKAPSVNKNSLRMSALRDLA